MDARPIDIALRWAQDHDMNQSGLASALGVSPQHVTNWKSRDLPADRFQEVAELFGKTVDELLGKPAPNPAQQRRA